jgi:hypothetical protein
MFWQTIMIKLTLENESNNATINFNLFMIVLDPINSTYFPEVIANEPLKSKY